MIFISHLRNGISVHGSTKSTMQGKLIALLWSLSCKPTIFTLHDEKRKDKSRNMLSLQDPGDNNTQSLPIKLQLNQTNYLVHAWQQFLGPPKVQHVSLANSNFKCYRWSFQSPRIWLFGIDSWEDLRCCGKIVMIRLASALSHRYFAVPMISD